MKKSLIISLSFIFWLFLIEYSSLYYLKNFGDGLDKAKVLLRPDKTYAWIQVENYSGKFIGENVTINNQSFRGKLPTKDNSLRILVLGPSSAFGWGVNDEQTYSNILKKNLLLKKNIKVEVLNASQIGYSSYQGKILSKEHPYILKFDPDLIVVAYGVNDIDRHRFFYQSSNPDKEALTQDFLTTNFNREKILNSSYALSLLNRKVLGFMGKKSCVTFPKIPPRRVSLRSFKENVIQIQEVFKKPIIFINTAHAYKGSPQVSYMNEESLELLNELSDQELESHLNKKGDQNSHLWYLLALRAGKAKDCNNSQKFLEKALKLEEFRIAADLKFMNQELKKFSIEKGYFYADAFKLLDSKDIPFKYFVDPIHPNALGHEKIALDIASMVIENNLYERR